MSAQKAIIHETGFLSHFGFQNSMVCEFLKYLRIIFQKYVTNYQLFSIFRIMLSFIKKCAKIKRAKIIGKKLEIL